MRASLEIGVFILVTAGMIRWIHKRFIGDASPGDWLGIADVKIFFWIIVIFSAINIISDNLPICVPVLPRLVTNVGVVASFGSMVAGYVANRFETSGLDRTYAFPASPRNRTCCGPGYLRSQPVSSPCALLPRWAVTGSW